MDFVTEPVALHVSEQIATWTPDYEFPPAPYYESCSVTVTDTDHSECISNAEAEVKVRGNWTTTYDKKPLRIKFTEKQNMLGMNDGAEAKNWLLLAEYKDASMLRDKAVLQAANEILAEDGLYASDAAFAEVFINGQYWGVYLVAEQQQIHPDRVNIAEPDQETTDPMTGYFLEFDGYYYNEDPLQQCYVTYADNAPLTPFDGEDGGGRTMCCLPENDGDPKKKICITIKSPIRSQEQHDFISDYLNNVYTLMYAAAYENKAMVFNEDYTALTESDTLSPQEAVEQAVDVHSLADMYIISELACDADIYWSSFFMDVDFSETGSKKLRFEAPWDFDSSMGNKDRCADGTGFYAANIVPDVDGGPEGNGSYNTINPWMAVLMYQDWYQDIIREKWTKAYDSGVFDRVSEMIEHDKTAYQNAFERNYKKWNNIVNNESFRNELSEKAKKCKTQEEAADYLNDWLIKRVSFLNDYWHQ